MWACIYVNRVAGGVFTLCKQKRVIGTLFLGGEQFPTGEVNHAVSPCFDI
jgi:hypothetical protein